MFDLINGSSLPYLPSRHPRLSVDVHWIINTYFKQNYFLGFFLVFSVTLIVLYDMASKLVRPKKIYPSLKGVQ